MVKEWRNVVVIGVINCADELNAPICREHSIDAFPTLKVFYSIFINSILLFTFCLVFPCEFQK